MLAPLAFLLVSAAGAAAGGPDFDAACQAAKAPVDFGPYGNDLPGEFKRGHEAYRKLWQGLCEGKGPRDLSGLLAATRKLEGETADVNPNVMRYCEGSGDDECWDKFRRWAADSFPAFTPVFVLTASEVDTGLDATLSALGKAAAQGGDDEDRRFFEGFLELRGDDGTPWREEKRDDQAAFVGCLDFGYDWVGGLKRTRALRKPLKKQAYLAELGDFEQFMLVELGFEPQAVARRTPTAPAPLCICGSPEDVVPSYEKVVAYLEGQASDAKPAKQLRRRLELLKGRKVRVLEDSKSRCGGG